MSEHAPTLGGVLREATRRLAAAGVPDPREQAEYLLTHLLGTDRGGLVVRREDRLEPAMHARYAEWIERRTRREPPQHIVGEQEFYGIALICDGRALVPRPETELLVQLALSGGLPAGARVLDVGTGSGCVAIALAVERPDFEICALDRSRPALALARDNLRRHGLVDRIELVEADLAAIPRGWERRFDLVVSNPPYVTDAEWVELESEVRDHDPREALVAGPSGLEAYSSLIPAAAPLLVPGGRLLLELGWRQSGAVRELVQVAGYTSIEIHPDLRGIPRALLAVWPPGVDCPR